MDKLIDKHGREYVEKQDRNVVCVRATLRDDGMWWGTKRWLRLGETRQTECGYSTYDTALIKAGRLSCAADAKAE